MFSEFRRLPAELVTYLTAWESEHNIPVRVLSGGWTQGHAQPNNNWTDRQVRDTEFTRQQASGSGLTIVACAASTRNAWLDYGSMIPCPPGTDQARAEARSIQDLFTAYPPGVDDPRQLGREYEFGDVEPIVWHCPSTNLDRVYGEIGDRVVFYYFSLETCSPIYWDYDALFAPLEDAIDGDAANERYQRMLSESFTNFMEFMNEGRINRQIHELRTTISANERNITTWQNSLAQAMATVTGIRDQIEQMMAAANRSEDEWRQQYEMVANNPAVDEVLFRRNQLRIKTNHIRMRGQRQYEGQSRWLGRFQITVDLTNYSVQIRNMDNPIDGRDHPHVPGGGPCFGGNASEFVQLIGNGQFGIFIELIIAWLEQYNPADDWGQYARYWFDREDNDPRPEFQHDTTDDATADQATDATPATA